MFEPEKIRRRSRRAAIASERHPKPIEIVDLKEFANLLVREGTKAVHAKLIPGEIDPSDYNKPENRGLVSHFASTAVYEACLPTGQIVRCRETFNIRASDQPDQSDTSMPMLKAWFTIEHRLWMLGKRILGLETTVSTNDGILQSDAERKRTREMGARWSLKPFPLRLNSLIDA